MQRKEAQAVNRTAWAEERGNLIPIVTTRLLAAGGEDRDVRKMDYLSPIDAPVAADDGRRDVRWSPPRTNTEGENPDSVCDLISV